MLLVEDLADWFSSSLQTKVYQLELPEKSPSRAVSIADTGGLALRVEGRLDVPTFQFLIRDNHPRDARDLAFELDRVAVDELRREEVGGVLVTDCGRVGGRPQPLGQDDRNRWVWSGNYWLESERLA